MTDHPDLIALLAAVLAAPADDVPRLAYADRLEELGEPERAEFIRVQCELAATPETVEFNRLAYMIEWAAMGPDEREGKRFELTSPADRIGVLYHRGPNPRYAALRGRERELLGNHGEQWAKDALGDHYRPFLHGGGRVEFRRGFVAHVTCPLAAWLGERCGRCRGDGRVGADRPFEYAPNATEALRCPDCRGTGYVGGVAVAVCGSQPVEAVTLSDRGPNDYGPPEDGRRFGWVRQSNVWQLHQPFVLPALLYDNLQELPDWNDGRCPTRRAALDALSAAALVVGREWAKLGKSRASETRELHQ